MADYWEAWSTDPNANTGAPPNLGAPELMKAGKLNDTMRVVMAACRQLGDRITGAVAGLGTMASQNANAVNITGGTIIAVGTGITALTADNLGSGIVPRARLGPSPAANTYDINI